MNSNDVKELLFKLEADLCGIASMNRLGNAPKGFHPKDVLPSCKSVIVFANKFLAGTLACRTTIPYTVVRNVLSDKMDKIAVQFCAQLEELGILAVPTGTIGPSEFDESSQRMRQIVSAKHCAQAAGLGVIGRNTLLITPEYGNMVWLSVILTELNLEPDELLDRNYCGRCHLCEHACPVQAIGEPEMNQSACWEYAFGSEGQGDWRIKCHRCRDACPHCFGNRNRDMRRFTV